MVFEVPPFSWTNPAILAFWVSMFTRSTLIICCIATIVRIYCGARYWANINLTILLIGTSIGGGSAAYFLAKIRVFQHYEGNILWFAITFAFRDLTFNISHQILAWRYHVIARDTIKLLKREEQTVEQLKRDTWVYWILMALNILFPILVVPSTILLYDSIYIDGVKATPGVVWFFNISNNGVGVMQVISGFYLIGSITKIRSFFTSQKEGERLNNSILALHASAFGLYLVSVIFFYACQTFKASVPQSSPDLFKFANNLFSWALIGYLFCNWISQLLILVIFWDMGYRKEEYEVIRASQIEATGDFDEEAEMQARIWNRFQEDDRRQTYRVSMSSIISSRASAVLPVSIND